MKLPGRTEGAVQQLGSVDPGVYAQRGEAFGGMVDAAQDITGELWDARVKSTTTDAILAMSNKEVELTEDYGDKRNFTAAEMAAMGVDVPEHMRERRWQDSAGVWHSEDRNDIPAEEFMPQYRKDQLEAEVAERVKSIPGQVNQAEFLARQLEAINRQYENDLGRAQIAREQRLNSKYDAQIANAEAAGSYDLARQMVRGHSLMNPGEKDQEIARLYQEEEQRYLAGKRDSGTDTQLRQELDRLTGKNKAYGQDEDGDFHNSLDRPKLQQEINAIKGTLKAREQDRKDTQEVNKAQAYSGIVDLILDPEESFEAGVNAINEGVAAGMISASQSDALKDLQTNRGKIDPKRDKTHALETLSQDSAKFATADLDLYRGFVDEGQLAVYRKRQKAMQNDRGRATSQENLRKQSIIGLDIDSSDPDDIPRIQLLDITSQVLIDNYQQKNGVPPVGRDMQKIYQEASQIVREIDSSERFKVEGKFWKRSLEGLDVPDDFISDIVAGQTAAGKPVSKEMILKRWEAWQAVK